MQNRLDQVVFVCWRQFPKPALASGQRIGSTVLIGA